MSKATKRAAPKPVGKSRLWPLVGKSVAATVAGLAALVSVAVGITELADRTAGTEDSESGSAKFNGSEFPVSSEAAQAFSECQGLLPEQVAVILELVRDGKATPTEAQQLIRSASCAVARTALSQGEDKTYVIGNGIEEDALRLTQSNDQRIRNAIADVIEEEYSPESLAELEKTIKQKYNVSELPFSSMEQGGGEGPPFTEEERDYISAVSVVYIGRFINGENILNTGPS